MRATIADVSDLEDLDRDLSRLKVEEEAGPEEIDPYKYQRRRRFVYAVFLGAGLAGLSFLILEMVDQRRNPCERVRDYLCDQDSRSFDCEAYKGVTEESIEGDNSDMRSAIRAQCETQIQRLLDEEGITVP